MENKILKNVRSHTDSNGVVHYNIEDIAHLLGLTQIKNNKTYVRWDSINKHLKDINFPGKVGKDEFISVEVVCYFCSKLNNKTAKKIRAQLLEQNLSMPAKVTNIEKDRGVTVFKNEEFGEVRTVIINGEPWFVGKDIAKNLGYADENKAITMHVDDEDKKLNDKTSSSFGQRGTHLINESGMYSLIISSKLPAAKRFKRWVTSEVLPQIRKTGSYSVLPTPSYQISDPIARARKWIEEEESRQALEANVKQLEEANNNLNVSLDEEREFKNTVFDTQHLLTYTQAARLISKKIKVGRQKMLSRLRQDGIIDKDNIPYAAYIQRGYFETKEYLIVNNGADFIKQQGYITQKGLEWLIKRFTRILSEEAI